MNNCDTCKWCRKGEPDKMDISHRPLICAYYPPVMKVIATQQGPVQTQGQPFVQPEWGCSKHESKSPDRYENTGLTS